MVTLKWLLGLILGLIFFQVGNGLIVLLVQWFFDLLPYWGAATLGVITMFVGAYKLVDFAFYLVPYRVIGVDTMALYKTFRWIIIIAALLIFFNHETLNDNIFLPKWLLLTQQVFYIGGTVRLRTMVGVYVCVKRLNDPEIGSPTRHTIRLGLVTSLKKSIKLKKISRKVAPPFDLSNPAGILESLNRNEDEVFDAVYQLALSDDLVSRVLKRRNVDKNLLRKIYNKLELSGAGQHVAGHYVPASCLVYPLPLTFLLDHFDGEDFKVGSFFGGDANMFIASRMIDYFEKGEVGIVRY